MVFDEYNFDNLLDEGRRLVIEELKSQLTDLHHDVCVCNECVVDMAALALNQLPPRYRCSLMGSIYLSDDTSDPVYRKKLKDAVKTAIERVSRNPGHE
jgi:competence protein ComFB